MPGGVYTGGGATVVMDSPALVFVKVFRKEGEPDGYIKSTANKVAIRARAIAPHRTYALRNSITVSPNRDAKGNFAFGYKVYTPIRYGFYVHEGTGPSKRQSFPATMRFAGTNGFKGKIVFTDVVHHPGTPAQPFLQDALSAMVD